ncbi:MAG TPA: protein phosphatase 2C domain-containing protein [Candidatus Binatus sp.]|uniref:PP2C family protein-serine/threonine phosphatase n=1 Tax=Candidatus Binatus sp. TaxID=2811406 RepID=UPI002B4619A2|nr:protein phosphatase 2C domain-containing protein [Candidatus Binatus sp.]HKN13722.1 protein phosphatase 2C domain-containing protein [Candidatus Binatus sp.]
MDSPSSAPPAVEQAFELALLSDVGTTRPDNEDSCGHFIENPDSVAFAVADGVGGYEGGEIASRMAIDITLEAYRESPPEWGAAKRLYRAITRANIEIHDKALTVPELSRMATTMTAVVVEKGILSAVHIGDCRLHLIRHSHISVLTKDHTMVAEKVRMGMMTAARAKTHPERGMLLRSLGRELIASIDRITLPLFERDRLVLCSDGLYNVLDAKELESITRDVDAETACRNLIDTANERGTHDNLTCAVFRMTSHTGHTASTGGWRDRLRGLFGR